MFSTPKYSILLVAIATLLIGIWSIFPLAPTIVKFIYSIFLYCSVIFIPYSYYTKNDFGLFINTLLFFLFISSFLQILMTIYNTDPDIYENGSKWITLFLNEGTIISLFPPFFIFLASRYENLILLSKSIVVFIVLALLMSPISRTSIAFLPVFFILFFPYISFKYRIAYFLTIIVSLIEGLSGARMLLIANAFCFAALFFTLVFKSKVIRIVFACLCILIPFFFFIPVLGLSKGELSLFQTILKFLAENNLIDDTNDTRTFLYLEVALDINTNNTWIFGKGAYCHYFSAYFNGNGGDSAMRMGTEVPFLNMLLHGGLVYVFLYYLILLIAVIKGLFFGKSRFVQMASILITGWFVNSFIGDLNGFRFYHLGFFFLVGCCLSKRMLSFTDKDIQLIIDGQYNRIKVLKILLISKLLEIKKKNSI